MSNHPGRTIGILDEDAPALIRALRGIFSESQLNQLREAYSHSAQNELLEHSSVTRKEKQSFNPLPARICRILLTEYDKPDLSLLISALKNPLNNPHPAVQLASMLDTIRHLHMMNKDDSYKLARLNEACSLLKSVTDPECQKLKELLGATIERYQRFYS
ncbi:MAG: hypothetical protein D6719_01825 [Candidatus Dadabacteria bacterium]|nr:MAG: hypothetical protein D6719_01825 [Candidatus Dadabacteria bacterium]